MKVGEKYKRIEPIYTILKQIDTNDYRIGFEAYTGVKGQWLLEDQFGHRIVSNLKGYEKA